MTIRVTSLKHPRLIVMRGDVVVARFQPVKYKTNHSDGSERAIGEFLTDDEELAVYIKKNCPDSQIILKQISDVSLHTLEDGAKKKKGGKKRDRLREKSKGKTRN